MTLILTVTNPAYTLQVSDRLLTRGETLFDDLSNKAVVFRARDALVSIAYSGLAYIRGHPTEQWLAEQLSGIPVTERGIHITRLPRWFDIGGAVRHLERACNTLPTAWRRAMGEVVIAGWQWPVRKPTRLRQILWLIQSPSPRAELRATQPVARHLPTRDSSV